jgi:hypothetical protein
MERLKRAGRWRNKQVQGKQEDQTRINEHKRNTKMGGRSKSKIAEYSQNEGMEYNEIK